MPVTDDDVRLGQQIDRMLAGDPGAEVDADLASFASRVSSAAPQPRLEYDAALTERLQSMDVVREEKMRLRHRGLLRLAVALLVIFGFVSIALAVDEILRRTISYDPGLSSILQNDGGHELDLTQLVDNLTVHVQWAYADANRVSVGYTISGDGILDSPAENYYPRSTLTDADGNEIELAGGVGATGEGGDGAQVDSFDLTTLETLPDVLDLTLTVQVEIMTAESFATLDARPTPAPDSTPFVTMRGDPDSPFDGPYGPFVFNFSVPVGEANVIPLGLTVTDQETTITLEQVIITPSETRIELCFTPPEEKSGGWGVHPVLLINGEDDLTANPPQVGGVGEKPIDEESRCRHIIYRADFSERVGEWQFMIRELIGFGDSGADQTRIVGDWSFTFTVE